MENRVRVAAACAILGLLATGLWNWSGKIPAPWSWALALLASLTFCWAVMTYAVEVMVADPNHLPRLRKMFAHRRAGLRYRRLIHPFAQWPLDWRMYDWSLRLALIYPIGFALLAWAAGLAVELGGVELIAAEPSAWSRAAVLGATFGVSSWVLLTVLQPVASVACASTSTWFAQISGAVVFAVIIAFIADFTFAVGIAMVSALTVAFAGVLSVAPTMAIAITFAGNFEVPSSETGRLVLSLIIAASVLIGLKVKSIAARGAGGLAYLSITIFGFGAVYATIGIAEWSGASADRKVAILFLALLPLLNAVFDYLSYLVTFWLLRQGYKRPRWAMALALFDLALASLMYLLAGAGIALAITVANHLANVPLFPLLPLFDGIRADPWAYTWVYLMLFSTFVPTAAHLGIGVFSLGALLPPSGRDRLQAGIGAPDAVPAVLTPLFIGLYWTLCLALPMLLLAGLIWAFGHWVFPSPFTAYLDLLKDIVVWAEANLP